MIWYVRRRDDGSIASAHQEMQPDYAEEARDDTTDAALIAFLDAAKTPPPVNLVAELAMMETELDDLKTRMSRAEERLPRDIVRGGD